MGHSDESTDLPRPLLEISNLETTRMTTLPYETLSRFWLHDHARVITVQYTDNGRGVLVAAFRVHNGFKSQAHLTIDTHTGNTLILR